MPGKVEIIISIEDEGYAYDLASFLARLIMPFIPPDAKIIHAKGSWASLDEFEDE